jgi:hypothetical protein
MKSDNDSAHGTLESAPVFPKEGSKLSFTVKDSGGKTTSFDLADGQAPQFYLAMTILLWEAWTKKESLVIESMTDPTKATGAGVPNQKFFRKGAVAPSVVSPTIGKVTAIGIFGRGTGVWMEIGVGGTAFQSTDPDKIVEFTLLLTSARLFDGSVKVASSGDGEPTIDSIEIVLGL